MFDMNNKEKRKLSLSGASSEPIISAESKRDPRLIATQSPRMTGKVLSFLRLRGAGKKQKKSSLILRKAKFQAIFKFVLSSASGGAGGGKYNRISAFVSMSVLLIRRSREKFFQKNFRDDSFSFLASPKDSLHRHSEPKAKNPKKTGTVMPDLIGHLSRIKKEVAEIAFGAASQAPCLGSRLLSCPRMTMLWILRLRLRMTMKRMLLRMTISMLALILTLITITESRADDIIPTSGTCNNAGTCLWKLDSAGILTISAKDGANDVIMDDYYCYATPCDKSSLISRPWEANLQQIKSVVIGDNITHIGDDAFQNASNLTSVTGMKDVKTIGSNGVFAYTGLTSITIPEGVTSIGYEAFWAAKSLTSITIPDNINTENWAANVFYHFPEGADIVCQGDLNTCYEKLARYFTSKTCPQNLKDVCNCSSDCILPTRVKEATDPSQCSGNYGWSGAGCSRKNADGSVPCASGFVEWDKQCLDEYPFAKKRWTPAEANEWLHDGNDNFVVITFKK